MGTTWGTIGGVFGVSLGVTVLVVVMFSLGVAAWTRAGGVPRRGRSDTVAAAAAVVCFAACLAIAAYGIDLIIPG
ncbi:hypothetical protein ACFV27_26345 [Streptomyces antimycoticus]|uniref:Secreted protein n=3 Tax=Streptomyces TaxID=1883 RepID=A0ABD5J846_9ACTN|nr:MULTISPECIES: hypothetical protein [Streptomyces]MEE4584119.1 hypothetical protein [Streptomyces sp. DSM 41602]AJZ84293.1 hypothetical protein AS97_20495 [Streptomyces sp. AgN23]KUL45211.1 hypothetical protein ADL28_37360 [Streptomyces violaceusniger]RSS37020.1 hypothetical protein EF902_33870 [Streptomyces sp. WAC05858]WJE01693.1 hypothetical protein QR300_40365 [Streptomyces antimycoticus]